MCVTKGPDPTTAMRQTTFVVTIGLVAVAGFLTWRFIRPMNIFVVSEAFERPVDTTRVPEPLATLRAEECAVCHSEFYDEWKTSIHSRAWTEPYFQADWKFDGSQQICRNCHTPLDRQQPHRVLGFRDREKWDPILGDNPDFDWVLQQEGVTCAGCHVRDGKILGIHGLSNAPHPVERIVDPNQICTRCHVVGGARRDTFFRFPPCGTVAEIQAGRGEWHERSGEVTVEQQADLDCVSCHMPSVQRPLVAGGSVRTAARHLWRGGHDPEMVKQGLEVRFDEAPSGSPDTRAFVLTLTNTGTAHYLPTGTPDRHLTVELRVLDERGRTLDEQTHVLRRTVMWRPFIVDLWDTRLAFQQPRRYRLEVSLAARPWPAAVEASVRYHLVDEKRRRRIDYANPEPIAYDIFRKRILLRRAAM